MLEKNTLKCWYHPGFQVFGPCFFSYAGVSPWIFGWAMHLFSISNTPLRIASARCIYAATLLFWSKGHGLLHKGQTYDCSDYRYRMNMYEININIKMKICNPYVCVCIYIYLYIYIYRVQRPTQSLVICYWNLLNILLLATTLGALKGWSTDWWGLEGRFWAWRWRSREQTKQRLRTKLDNNLW